MSPIQAPFTAAEIPVSLAARIARCSADTILRWIDDETIVARRISDRGWYRVDYESLLKHLAGQLRKNK